MSEKNKKRKNPPKIFTLDTETRGLFGEIFRVGLYCGNKYHASDNFEDIKNLLVKYSTKYECHVYIHNLDFDLSKLIHDVIPNAELKNSLFINNNVTTFTTSLTSLSDDSEDEILSEAITWHDSSKIVTGTLKKICQDFGLAEHQSKIDLKQHILNLGWARNSKGQPIKNINEYDAFESEGYYFKNVHPWESELNAYLRMDCESLYEIINQLVEISELELEDFLRCPTTASLALKIFKTNYEKDYKKIISTNYLTGNGRYYEKYIRSAYTGGRTEVFIPLLKNGYHYDVNSLYPYVMENYRLPYGYCQLHEGDKARQTFKYWYNFNKGAGFIHADVYVPDMFLPPLPVMRGKLLFPVGNIRGYWSFEEIKLALEVGCEIRKIHSCLYFDKTDYLFKDFIKKYKHIKNTTKGAYRYFAKLVQNSLYGKFAMQRVRETLLDISELEKCKQRYEDEGLMYCVLKNPLIGDFIKADIEVNSEYIQPHISAYITSLARIELYRGLQAQYKKGDISYCDTDSIVCQHKMDDDKTHHLDYGKWKLENRVKEGIFLQPKVYYESHPALVEDDNGLYLKLDKDNKFINNIKETKKFKGIPKRKMMNITRHTYEDILAKLQEMQTRLSAGEVIDKSELQYPLFKDEEKRIKFATNLKNPQFDNKGEVTFDKKLIVQKNLNLAGGFKRDIDYINNTSKPLVFHDF